MFVERIKAINSRGTSREQWQRYESDQSIDRMATSLNNKNRHAILYISEIMRVCALFLLITMLLFVYKTDTRLLDACRSMSSSGEYKRNEQKGKHRLDDEPKDRSIRWKRRHPPPERFARSLARSSRLSVSNNSSGNIKGRRTKRRWCHCSRLYRRLFPLSPVPFCECVCVRPK